MSFFFYSKDGTTNVVVDLMVLELVVGTAATTYHTPVGTAGKWDLVMMFTMQALTSGGKITVIVKDEEQDGDHWRHPLKDVPAPYRERITRVLEGLMAPTGLRIADMDIEVLRH